MIPPAILPQVTIQNDAISTVKNIEQGLVRQEDIWVSCHESSKPTIHGKVNVTLLDQDRSQCAFKGRDGVECRKVTESVFQISCPALGVANRKVHFPTCTIILPASPTTQTPLNLDRAINSLDLSYCGAAWVVGLGNGSIIAGKSYNSTEPRVRSVHEASVSTVRFVPSVETLRVRVLSSSEDFSLALTEFNLDDPNVLPPILRFTSHTQAVTSFNFIFWNTWVGSADRSGTLRIWDTSGRLGQWGMVQSTGNVSITATSCKHPLMVLALQSGHFDIVAIGAKSATLFTSNSDGSGDTRNGPLCSILMFRIFGSFTEYVIVTGSQRGILSFHMCEYESGKVSVRTLGRCIRNEASISDIKIAPSYGKYPYILVTTTDGLPYKLEISDSSSGIAFKVVGEYAGGPQGSPAQSIACSGSMVWVAGHDGAIWAYLDSPE